MAKPPRASGGVAAELGVIDPRTAVRERVSERPTSQGRRRPGGDPSPPPRPPTLAPSPNDLDPYETALQVLPRTRGRKTGKVRVYHRTGEKGVERCWAFTLTAEGYQRLLTDRVLTHEGTTYPDGKAVVPRGGNPLDHPIHCGSCGTHSVECLQIEFLAD